MWMLTAGATLALAPVTQAETPDGETPAEETVCDSLADGAAWGLCNAYCEAMDCDSADPRASDAACQHVLGSFLALESGPIPCACPCYTEADLNGLVTECESSLLVCFPSVLACRLTGDIAGVVGIGGNAACVLVDQDGPTVVVEDLTIGQTTTCLELVRAKQSEVVCGPGP
jgi:hypothetical protein